MCLKKCAVCWVITSARREYDPYVCKGQLVWAFERVGQGTCSYLQWHLYHATSSGKWTSDVVGERGPRTPNEPADEPSEPEHTPVGRGESRPTSNPERDVESPTLVRHLKSLKYHRKDPKRGKATSLGTFVGVVGSPEVLLLPRCMTCFGA
eukprot:318998-Amphidinium_carterae.1